MNLWQKLIVPLLVIHPANDKTRRMNHQFLSSNRYNVIKAELNEVYYHFPPQLLEPEGK